VFGFIEEQKGDHPVPTMSRVLGVSRSSPYAWCRSGLSARAMEDADLLPQTRRRPRAEAELVLQALEMAVWNRGPEPGTVHHSDQGGQYTSLVFTTRLAEAGIHGSMGTVGDALDNAAVESLFVTLQTELLDRGRWPTRRALMAAIFSYIEGFYNRTRRHSTLGYLSPKDYEEVMLNSMPVTETREAAMVAS